jgi:TolB-like protein/Flp pilus assembly protein TadD
MTRLLESMRRRKMVQWIAGYAAASWALLQGIDMLAGQFGWSGSVFRVAFALLLAGLFGVSVVAWFHGERGQQRVTPKEGVILAVIAVLGGIAAWNVRDSEARSPIISGRQAIAVMTFEDLSGKDDARYFADGIAEDIRTELAQVAGIDVISRSSVLAVGTDNPRDIARELNAGFLVEGSVRRLEDSVRITVRLISTATGTLIWSTDYDRDLSDVFAIQKDVAGRIVRSLRLALSEDEQQRLARPRRIDPVAYDLLLRSQAFPESGRAQNEAAIALLTTARDVDPQSADVLAALSVRYTSQSMVLGMGGEWSDSAESIAHAALALDSVNANAHYALAVALASRGRMSEARMHHMQRLTLVPNDVASLSGLAIIDLVNGDPASASHWIIRGLRLDPKSPHEPNLLAWIFLMFGANEQARMWVDTSLARQPGFQFAQSTRVAAALSSGDSEAAVRSAREMERAHPDNPSAYAAMVAAYAGASAWTEVKQYAERLAAVDYADVDFPDYRIAWARAYFAQDQPDSARALLRTVTTQTWPLYERGEANGVQMWSLAAAHALLGDTSSALSVFDRLATRLAVPLGWLSRDPALSPLHDTPRFSDALAAMQRRAAAQLTLLEQQLDTRSRDDLNGPETK